MTPRSILSVAFATLTLAFSAQAVVVTPDSDEREHTHFELAMALERLEQLSAQDLTAFAKALLVDDEAQVLVRTTGN